MKAREATRRYGLSVALVVVVLFLLFIMLGCASSTECSPPAPPRFVTVGVAVPVPGPALEVTPTPEAPAILLQAIATPLGPFEFVPWVVALVEYTEAAVRANNTNVAEMESFNEARKAIKERAAAIRADLEARGVTIEFPP